MSRVDPDPPFSIIAVHGNGGGGFRFEQIHNLFPPSVTFRAPTLPGFADVPADQSLKTMYDFACRLHEFIIGTSRPRIILGHGIGGSLTLEYVQHFASEVDGLIIHSPVGSNLNSRFIPQVMKLPGARSLGRMIFSSQLARPIFARLLFSSPLPKSVRDRFFDEYRRCSVFAQMFDLISVEWFKSLNEVRIPTTLLWGKRDNVLSLRELDFFKQFFENLDIQVEPNWAHFPMLDAPEDYARKIYAISRRLIGER